MLGGDPSLHSSRVPVTAVAAIAQAVGDIRRPMKQYAKSGTNLTLRSISVILVLQKGNKEQFQDSRETGQSKVRKIDRDPHGNQVVGARSPGTAYIATLVVSYWGTLRTRGGMRPRCSADLRAIAPRCPHVYSKPIKIHQKVCPKTVRKY